MCTQTTETLRNQLSMASSVDVYAWGRHYLQPSSGISDSLHPEQSFDAIGIAHLAVEVIHFDTCGYGWTLCVQLIAIQCVCNPCVG